MEPYSVFCLEEDHVMTSIFMISKSLSSPYFEPNRYFRQEWNCLHRRRYLELLVPRDNMKTRFYFHRKIETRWSSSINWENVAMSCGLNQPLISWDTDKFLRAEGADAFCPRKDVLWINMEAHQHIPGGNIYHMYVPLSKELKGSSKITILSRTLLFWPIAKRPCYSCPTWQPLCPPFIQERK